jgi:fucose permease
LLFLYGGLETCLGGWLTTFALRYGSHTPGAFAVSEYTTLLMWMGYALGRPVSSRLMLRMGEKTLQRVGLGASIVCVAGLTVVHGGVEVLGIAAALGLSLSPFFPATFALLMAERPTASQAGMVIAASGLGAASLPWLMGVVSTRTGSLMTALGLPLAAAALLLAMSLLTRAKGPGRVALKA